MKLYILFLNTLHNIEKSSFWYYYCEHLENGIKCKMCSIPIILSDFEKDVERNLFDVNFLFNYYTKLWHELLELFDQKKELVRVSTSFVVGIGTLESAGVSPSLRAFNTMNSFKLLVSEDKNYLYLLNFRVKKGNNLTRLFNFL